MEITLKLVLSTCFLHFLLTVHPEKVRPLILPRREVGRRKEAALGEPDPWRAGLLWAIPPETLGLQAAGS